MDLEKRITNLENLVYSLIKRIDNDKFYSNADSDGIKRTESDNTVKLQSDIDFIAMETGVELEQE